jgi:hypothetical protein
MTHKPGLKRVLQVAVVVRNVEAAVQRYADEYGIKPWAIYELNPDTVEDMIVRGEPQTYSMKIALADLKGVEFELIEPLDEKSIYAEFLKEHGEGIHHLAFDVGDYDETMKFFFSRGHKILQGGTWNGETYTYLDTRKDLGIITEIYKRTSDFKVPEPADTYPKKI